MRAALDLPGLDLSGIDTWIFDLDNTLYHADVSFFADIGGKMTEFIARHLALQSDEMAALQQTLSSDYGKTLSGLIKVHGMDPAPFLDYVHDVDLSVLSPQPALRAAIAALPGRKLIFTNGSRGHIRNVGTHLNLLDLFDGGFAIEDAHYVPKPAASAYETFNDTFGIEPARCIFFEDSLRNLEVPKAMGMRTVLVHAGVDGPDGLEVARPDGSVRKADWVDAVTDDLAGWLASNAAGPRRDVA